MKLYKKSKLLVCFALAIVVPVAYGASSTETPHHLVFASDSQYPWSDLTDQDITDPNKEARSKELIELQYSDISSFRKLNGGASRIPVMINGDTVSYTHLTLPTKA